MPSTTAWAIPYPNDTDPFTNGPTYSAGIAQRVDALMASLVVDVDRILTPPYASLENDTVQTTNIGDTQQTSEFTEVNADTGGYTNLSNDASSITMPSVPAPTVATGGRYLVNGYMWMSNPDETAPNALYYPWNMQIWKNGVATTQYADRQLKSDIGYRATLGNIQHLTNVDVTTGPGTFQLVEIVSFSAQHQSINQARFFVIWIADE